MFEPGLLPNYRAKIMSNAPFKCPQRAEYSFPLIILFLGRGGLLANSFVWTPGAYCFHYLLSGASLLRGSLRLNALVSFGVGRGSRHVDSTYRLNGGLSTFILLFCCSISAWQSLSARTGSQKSCPGMRGVSVPDAPETGSWIDCDYENRSHWRHLPDLASRDSVPDHWSPSCVVSASAVAILASLWLVRSNFSSGGHVVASLTVLRLGDRHLRCSSSARPHLLSSSCGWCVTGLLGCPHCFQGRRSP